MRRLNTNFKAPMIILIGLVCCISITQAQTFGDVTLPPNGFNLSTFMQVNYQFNNDSTITFAVKCLIPGQFFGLGLGTSMRGADIWAFQFNGSNITARDYYAAHEGHPTEDIDLGGTNNLVLLGYEITPNYTLAKVQRVLDTGDEVHDRAIQEGLTNFIFSTGPAPILVYHGPTHGTAAINLTNSTNSPLAN